MLITGNFDRPAPKTLFGSSLRFSAMKMSAVPENKSVF
jgi:hypothetical protein